MDFKSQLLLVQNDNQLIFFLFSVDFLGLFPASDTLRCSKCKALMTRRLSENDDPLKQLDSMNELLDVFVLPHALLFEKNTNKAYL